MSAGKGLALKLGVFDATGNWKRIVCAAFGHDVDGISWDRNGACCRRCAAPFLFVTQSETRISHTVSCFLCGHTYHPIGFREGHNEYVCVRCGHPLLFIVARDTYREYLSFTKRVRYLCNLFGHKVHQVTTRHNRTEYACDCGHSFLKRQAGMATVKHPLTCLLVGHFVHFLEVRSGCVEFLCHKCGHTFCFKEKNSKGVGTFSSAGISDQS
jgi:hypothetical protein